MTVASEIQRIKNNVAAAYAAAENKGAIMPATRNSNNLSTTISTIEAHAEPVLQDKTVIYNGEYTADTGYDGLREVTVAVNATGATERATNRTGAAINAGDKVWLNQEYYEAGAVINSASLYGNTYDIGTRTGLQDADLTCGLEHNNTSSQIRNMITGATSEFGRQGFSQYQLSYLYDEIGNCLVCSNSLSSNNYKAISFSNNNIVTIDLPNVGTWYPPSPVIGKFEYYIDTLNGKLYKINRNSGIAIYTKDVAFSSYTVSSSSCMSKGAGIWLDDAHILIPKSNTVYDCYSYNTTNETLELVQSNAYSIDSNWYPLGLTPDKKYVVCRSGERYKDGNYIYLWNPLSNTIKQYNQLNPKTYWSNLCVYYYPATGVYYENAIYPKATNGSLYYNLYRYNEDSEEFEQLSLDTNTFPYILAVSKDLDKVLWCSNVLGSGITRASLSSISQILGNNLVPFTQSTINTITGTAAENILAGATGNVYLGARSKLQQEKIIRQNGTYTADVGFDGMVAVDVGVGQVGETYSCQNLSGESYSANDKVWMNYRNTTTGDTISANCYWGTDNKRYMSANASNSKLFYLSSNNNSSYLDLITMQQGAGSYYKFGNEQTVKSYRDDGTILIYKAAQSYGGAGYGMVVSESEVSSTSSLVLNAGCYWNGYGFYTKAGTQIISGSYYGADVYAYSWTYNDTDYAIARHASSFGLYQISSDGTEVTRIATSIDRNLPRSINITKDKKAVVFTNDMESSMNSCISILKVNYTTPSLTEVTGSILPSSFVSALTNVCDSSFNPVTGILTLIPNSATNINQALVARYNPSTEVFDDITEDVDLISVAITGNYNHFIAISDDLKTIAYSNGGSNLVAGLQLRNAEGWVITNYSSINQNSLTGYAESAISAGATGNVIVGTRETPTGSLPITENGTYDVTNYAEAVVNISSDNENIYSLNMVEEVEDGLYNSSITIAGLTAAGILGGDATLTPLRSTWKYKPSTLAEYYQETLTSDHVYAEEKLTEVLGAVNE